MDTVSAAAALNKRGGTYISEIRSSTPSAPGKSFLFAN